MTTDHMNITWQAKFTSVLGALLHEAPPQVMVNEWLAGEVGERLTVFCTINRRLKWASGESIIEAAVSMTDASLVVQSE